MISLRQHWLEAAAAAVAAFLHLLHMVANRTQGPRPLHIRTPRNRNLRQADTRRTHHSHKVTKKVL